jgi:long-chain acyl-CoA synthetase
VDLQLGEIELGPREKGELLVKGPQIMKGYWNEPDSTLQVLKDGWLHTGDIVETDDEGFLYIVGRKRDRIVSSGHSIWPQEIEEVLEAHPKVKKAVVIGVPDLLRCAFDVEALVIVENTDSSERIEAELLDLCNKRLEFFKVPSKVTVVDDLPLTTFGKVDRVAIEAKFSQRF